jgi:hypothetical protein
MLVALHQTKLASLTHAPGPMRFLNGILISRQMGSHSFYW